MSVEMNKKGFKDELIWKNPLKKIKKIQEITKWSHIWNQNKPRLSELFSTKSSFCVWCGLNFFPKVPAEVSIEEIIALKKKKGSWSGKYGKAKQ